jgi:hypothetical protein
VICRADILLDVQLCTYCPREGRREAWVSIRYDSPWHAVMRKDLLRIDRSDPYGVHTFAAWEEQGSLHTIMIHNCQYGIIISILGQISDQIPANRLKRVGGLPLGGNGEYGDFGSCRIRFSALTYGTSLHVLYNKAFHVWPPIVSCDTCVCVENSRVAGTFMVVIHAENTPLQR